MHPTRMLQPEGPMSSEEFFDWWEAYRESPWGEYRHDLRLLCHATLATDTPPDRLAWPYWESDEEDQAADNHNPEEVLARLEAHRERYR